MPRKKQKTPIIDEEGFSRRFLRLREQRGLDMHYGWKKDLADDYEVSQSTVNRWTTENVVPGRQHLARMAQDLGVSVAELEYGETVGGKAMPASVSAQLLIDMVGIAREQKLPLEKFTEKQLETLLTKLHRHWDRYGRIEREDIQDIFEIVKLGHKK